MMHDSAPRLDPVLNLARNQMARVPHIHAVHLAIISGKDETQVVEFREETVERMLHEAIPAIIAEISALGVILSSPVRHNGRYGASVLLIDRLFEAFYVPIVRCTNADVLIGDFRPATAIAPEIYADIHAQLSANWLVRGDDERIG